MMLSTRRFIEAAALADTQAKEESNRVGVSLICIKVQAAHATSPPLISGKAHSEHIASGLAATADMGQTQNSSSPDWMNIQNMRVSLSY
jgi:hypothetical protein